MPWVLWNIYFLIFIPHFGEMIQFRLTSILFTWAGSNGSDGFGMPWEGSSDSSASTLSHTMDEYIIQESVLHSQSADVEVACGQHAMIQPLQRNWRWFHQQREQRAYLAFLEFVLPCLYLHSLKVSQLEKESQEQRERCEMLSAELENANKLKDVLEETVLRWKSFGIPECDAEVYATGSGQFLPPTYLPMTPRDSNNLKAKDVRADGLSDASATMPNRWCRKRGERRKEQCANAYAAAWKTAEEQPAPPICRTASDGRSDGDVESLNKASCPASDMDTHSGAPDVASETEATESSRFLQLIRLQDGTAENGSEFLPTELLPLLLDFLPVDEVVMFDVRAVSRFFASPKAWVFHLFKLMDIDSLPTEKQMHPVVESIQKCMQAEKEEPEMGERRGRLTMEYLLGTSERCRGAFVKRMLSETSSLHRACNLICRIVGSANIHELFWLDNR